ncbi:hypothetical protein GmHk_14G041813 [Glycine max]|nr:hypothetical protein GmHk_14G041813 [Glycine max]
MRSDTNTGVRGRASFLLIACERSSEYRPKKNDLVRTCTNSRKYGCPFKLRAKPVLGGEEWMVKLICGVYNHEMVKSLVGHPYAGRQTKDEKIVVANMMKSMRFQSLFMRVDALPWVIVIDKDLSLMDAVKTVFPDAMNLLCQFHIDKNVKAKCKTLVAQKNAWDYVMEAWGSLVDCPCESSFDEYLKKFEMACSLWPMFVDYDSIENIINVKTDGNCGYRAIAILLGMGEESWSLVCNHLHKELTSWLEEYINLLGGIERFKELKHSLLVDELSMVTMDKWMNITDMRYVIASRYNVLVVSLS